MKIQKSYYFSLTSSVLLGLFSFIITLILSYIIYDRANLIFVIITSLLISVFSFFIIQFRIERFIGSRAKIIYEEVSSLDVENITNKRFSSDVKALSKEFKKFAENKRLEIEKLQIREGYRREFLGNVSHELKTPLFTVQGYLLTLKDGAIKDKSIRDQYLKRANKGVERLINIVEDLDMIASLESGNLNLSFEKINIVRLIQNVFDLLEIDAAKKNIILTFDKSYETPIFVKCDLKRIEQVLINLIQNSIKYGKTNGKTLVNLIEYSQKKIMIKITDEGEGIKQQYIPRLFERFYRVDQSRSREQGGSGLGLSIVKHIIEAHHQEVFVESVPGKGSSFSFTLEKFK